MSCTPNPVPHGSDSTCTATAASGYVFEQWSGDCVGATCSFTDVQAAKDVAAHFLATQLIILAALVNVALLALSGERLLA